MQSRKFFSSRFTPQLEKGLRTTGGGGGEKKVGGRDEEWLGISGRYKPHIVSNEPSPEQEKTKGETGLSLPLKRRPTVQVLSMVHSRRPDSRGAGEKEPVFDFLGSGTPFQEKKDKKKNSRCCAPPMTERIWEAFKKSNRKNRIFQGRSNVREKRFSERWGSR